MKSEESKILLQELFTKYEQSMYRVAYAVLHNIQDAEDTVSDSFVKLANYLDNIDNIDSNETKKLIFCIVRNSAINKFKKNTYESNMFFSAEVKSVEVEYIRREHLLGEEKQLSSFQNKISKLPYVYQQILLLKCFYDLSYEEIAKRLNISVSTVTKRFERAKKQLIKQSNIL